MYLDRPAFSVSFPLESCLEEIESLIKSKHWTKFEVASVSLVYAPFFFFNYYSYLEEKREDMEQAVVSDTAGGTMAMDAQTNELDEGMASLFEEEVPLTSHRPPEGYKFEVERPLTSERDAPQIAQIKLAHKLELPKDHVIVSGLKTVYVPIWVASVSVAEGNYRLELSAVNGELLSEAEIPEREKGWLEVTAETLSELKEPGAWVRYSASVGNTVFDSLVNNPLTQSMMSNRQLQILLLAVIAVWLFFNIRS
ncbi:MAG: hypothetical protein J4203_04255 [Candidatus Diapherotrites archaeon]|uniref:Uncharacterized protein n=1 Tax=Candidatus Iainarchaeum sp. TaxID=3101447 RepID=A0A8T4LEK0_9ARCH|nr:hypothetical protein [Candidatus Diapherotrites archaeon]